MSCIPEIPNIYDADSFIWNSEKRTAIINLPIYSRRVLPRS
jgi:hypothetical protein